MDSVSSCWYNAVATAALGSSGPTSKNPCVNTGDDTLHCTSNREKESVPVLSVLPWSLLVQGCKLLRFKRSAFHLKRKLSQAVSVCYLATPFPFRQHIKKNISPNLDEESVTFD